MKLSELFFQLGNAFNVVKPLPTPSLQKHFIECDTKALQADWAKVGDAMFNVLDVIGQVHDQKNNKSERKNPV